MGFLSTTTTILAVAAVASIVSGKSLEDWNKTSKQCQEIFNVSEEIYTGVQKTMKVPDPMEYNQRCFMECLLKAEAIMTSEGELDKDQVVEMVLKSSLQIGVALDEEKFRSSLEYCSSVPDEGEACLKSYNTWLCFLKILQAGIPSRQQV